MRIAFVRGDAEEKLDRDLPVEDLIPSSKDDPPPPPPISAQNKHVPTVAGTLIPSPALPTHPTVTLFDGPVGVLEPSLSTVRVSSCAELRDSFRLSLSDIVMSFQKMWGRDHAWQHTKSG